MRNPEKWKPTKFCLTEKGWAVSEHTDDVIVGSRFVASIQLEACLRLLHEHARGCLLDLGCGDVPFYGIYKDLVETNICIDWPNSTHGGVHLDYAYDITRGIPLEDSSCDTILTTDVVEHIPDPTIMFSELYRVLKRGGKIILTTPFMYWLHEEPHDYFRFTEFALEKYCGVCGLQVIELFPYGGSQEIILDILAKKWSRSRLLSLLHRFYVKTLWRGRTNRKALRFLKTRFPLGYAMVALKS